MSTKIVVANWKMHKTFAAGLQLAQDITQAQQANPRPNVQIVLLPSFLHLEAIGRLIAGTDNLYLGAQHCHDQAAGAFTGAISVPMLASVGVRFVLVGHSEHRQHGGDDESLMAKQVDAVLAHGLQPILCCGEPARCQSQQQALDFVQRQLDAVLAQVTADAVHELIVAYEPGWAIGTQDTPDPAVLESLCQAIRHNLVRRYGTVVGEAIPLLYGGSCQPAYASTLAAATSVDGVLVGRASLTPGTFMEIVAAMTTT